MKYRSILALALTVCVSVAAGSVRAGDWPQWRGPNFNGSSDEKNLPSDWSRTENVAWSVALPGAAASTPIVCGDRVFLSGVDAEKDIVVAMCFDRAKGRLLWRHDLAEGTKRDDRSNFASPSPVTDGDRVIFFYANGDLISYDFDGKREWARNIKKDYGVFAFGWTFSSSPTLFGGKLYFQVLQRDVAVGGRGFADRKNDSYILAMDPATGKTLWRVVRESKAVAESREAFTTPIPFTHKGRGELLVVGGDALTGHDLETGKELWRWGTWNPKRVQHWRLVPSAAAGGGVILASAPKGEPVFAIKAGGSGLLDDDSIAWVSESRGAVSSDVPTAAYYDGDFFVLSDKRRAISRVEPLTGKVKWTIATPGRAKYEASPTVADGKIYIVNFDGEVAVIAADDGKVLKTVSMDEPAGREVVRASIAAAGGQLFIRTTRRLYCVGK